MDLINSSRLDNTSLSVESRIMAKKFDRITIALFSAGLCIFFSLASLPLVAQQELAEIRGVWMTANDMTTLRDRDRTEAAMRELSRLHFNTVYPVVWNGEFTYYPSKYSASRGIQSFSYRGVQGQDILKDVILQAHQHNLLVIPWFEFGFMTPLSSELARNHPHWLTQQRDGSMTSRSAAGNVAWLNPFHPEVQEFITGLVMEIVDNYDIDGIQFDDHMSLPSQFGYDTYSKQLYLRETSELPPENIQDPEWVRWRAAKITAFMKDLKKAIDSKKNKIIFSVSPNYYDFAYKLQLQDWLTWMRLGIINELIVQVYRPDLKSFLSQLGRAEILEAQKEIPTAIAIMTGQRSKPVPIKLIRDQVRASQQRNLGVAFFYYETLWDRASESPEVRKSGFQQLFARPAIRLT